MRDNTFYELYRERAIARHTTFIEQEDFEEVLRIIDPCINDYQIEKMIKEYRPCMNYSDEYLCSLDDTPETIAEKEKRNLTYENGHWYKPIEKGSNKKCLCSFEYRDAPRELLEHEYRLWRDKWRYEMAGEGLNYNAAAEHEADYKLKQIAQYIGYCVIEEDKI